MLDIRYLILYIVSRFTSITGRGIGRVRIMKILFLIDYYSLKMRGRKLTNISWVRLFFGPFSRSVLDMLDELVSKKHLVEERIEGVGVFYRSLKPVKGRYLDRETKHLIDSIVNEFGTRPLEELLDYVYSLPEVENRHVGENIL